MHKLSSAEIIARMKKNRQPCVETMGGEVLDVDPARGWIKMRWLARPEFCHSGNIVQGGFITGMVDSCMAHAAMVRGNFQMAVPTLEIKVSFFAPGHPGHMIAEGWVEQRGRSIVFTSAEVRTESGKLAAQASLTYKVGRPTT